VSASERRAPLTLTVRSFWFFFSKKNFFLKKEAKTFFRLGLLQLVKGESLSDCACARNAVAAALL
jgi:hypothetical protein